MHLEVYFQSFCITRFADIYTVGLLSTAIIKMDGVGGFEGWRWIFILEGIATVILSIISSLVMPADISSAKFLTEEEIAFACEYLTGLGAEGVANAFLYGSTEV